MKSALVLVFACLTLGCTTKSKFTVPVVTPGCDFDESVACTGGQQGYSCNGGYVPNNSTGSAFGVACAAGTPRADGSVAYCCDQCVWQQAPISGCQPEDDVYTCSAKVVPSDGVGGIDCYPGTTTANGAINYCCNSGADLINRCYTYATGGGCGSDSYFICIGNAAPDAVFGSGFSCGESTPMGTTGVDSTPVDAYCCSASSSGCDADDTVTCGAGTSGYTCAGPTRPDTANTSIYCGAGVENPNNDTVQYCCMPFTAGDCVSALVPYCDGIDYFGFVCSGGATPQLSLSGLTCSLPITTTDGTGYCCRGS
ncbi:MAG TPA: hypothetical protein VHB97_14610 [Polyangia bacterium]|jgi:hypothetical protein|nr:hypothetical protein [Polyangia bacterium]